MDKPFIINPDMPACSGESGANADVIILGGGPGGLTAAIYNARAGLKTTVIEKMALGGQIFLTNEIENYPGIENISGPELIKVMEKQAVNFGVNFVYDEAVSVQNSGKGKKTVKTASGKEFTSISVILSTGAKYRDVGVPGETEFKGRGISNCATCDGAFYKGLEVAVIGGGDTAVEEAVFLTRFASKVYVIHRRDRLRAVKSIQDRAFANPKIVFIFDSVVEEIKGDKGVESVSVRNVKTGGGRDLAVKGVFVFIGLIPNTGFLKGTVELDDYGYIKADMEMKTSSEGIFACGDCVSKNFRQAITAAGDGAIAANSARHYTEKSKGTEYI